MRIIKKNKINNSYRPLISIITVTYNRARYLEKTINSVINQKYKNYYINMLLIK